MSTEFITVGQLVERYKSAIRVFGAGAKVAVAEKVGPVTCRPNCSYCCYQKILSPTFVGVFVYLYLKREGRWTPEMRAKLVDADRDMTARTHRGWLMGKRPCPFLSEKSFGNGVCTIYAVRPEPCAITHSVSGDGAKCAVPDEMNLVSVVDHRALLPLLPLVMAVQKYSPPVVTTLPGSVLLAEAALEHLPTPDVASLPAGLSPLGTLEEIFDQMATVKDGE